ncbi:MAG TPA: UDP-N-acetylglucosamine 2-epimerase (non-hydrolyzing) [Bacteroidia bacterium]|nr:UDP-N-acetylglucosamine 2-epimerase (non-hydrolyzing) [Bacteroidia bacterium]
MKKLLLVVGTRPNYIKITGFKKLAIKLFPDKFDIKIIHTGQHFNKEMADDFFQQLDILPDYFLNIPPSSPNNQMAEIMLRLEKKLDEFKPDWVIVPGDVNSTEAAALCTHKCGYKLAHLESGLRSFDLSMPEEHNRIITDQLSDIFFVTEQSGSDNLLKENKRKEQIYFVGNTMIDTLVAFDEQIENRNIYADLGVKPKSYVLVTMHRPATVDNREGLQQLCDLLKVISDKLPVVFPIHPRTKKNLMEFLLWEKLSSIGNLVLTEPLSYFDFQNLVLNCKLVITDSGGIQEETTYRRIPCLTLRKNTERPVTITAGTNTLISFSKPEVLMEIDAIISGNYKSGSIPGLWDGKSTERILEIFLKLS